MDLLCEDHMTHLCDKRASGRPPWHMYTVCAMWDSSDSRNQTATRLDNVEFVGMIKRAADGVATDLIVQLLNR